jgi:hypothetical protein
MCAAQGQNDQGANRQPVFLCALQIASSCRVAGRGDITQQG